MADNQSSFQALTGISIQTAQDVGSDLAEAQALTDALSGTLATAQATADATKAAIDASTTLAGEAASQLNVLSSSTVAAVEAAQNTGIDAINTAATTAATQASNTAVTAVQSAQATALSQVQGAATSGVNQLNALSSSVSTSAQNALTNLQNAGTTATNQLNALASSIEAAHTNDIADLNATRDAGITAINQAVSAGESQISTAASAGVGTVTTAANTLANSLALDTGVTAGVYSNLTVNAQGRITAARQFNFDDITSALGYAPFNAGSPNFTGEATFAGSVTASGTGYFQAPSSYSGQMVLSASDNMGTTGYSLVLRNDGGNFYLLPSNQGETDGGYGSLRPLSVNLSTGTVSMLNGVSVSGGLTSDGVVVGTTNMDSSGHLRLGGNLYFPNNAILSAKDTSGNDQTVVNFASDNNVWLRPLAGNASVGVLAFDGTGLVVIGSSEMEVFVPSAFSAQVNITKQDSDHTLGSSGALQVHGGNDGAGNFHDAVMGFDVPGLVAINVSLTKSGAFSIGGWSFPVDAFVIDGSGSSYSKADVNAGGNANITGGITVGADSVMNGNLTFANNKGVFAQDTTGVDRAMIIAGGDNSTYIHPLSETGNVVFQDMNSTEAMAYVGTGGFIANVPVGVNGKFTVNGASLGATAGASGNIQINSTNDAVLSLTIDSVVATNISLSASDERIHIGGWSWAADRLVLDNTGSVTAAGTGYFQAPSSSDGQLVLSASDNMGTTGYSLTMRNDGSNFYLLTSNQGQSQGSWNALRPLWVNLSSGYVSMDNGVSVLGGLSADSVGANAISASSAEISSFVSSNLTYGSTWVYSTTGTGYVIQNQNVSGVGQIAFYVANSGTPGATAALAQPMVVTGGGVELNGITTLTGNMNVSGYSTFSNNVTVSQGATGSGNVALNIASPQGALSFLPSAGTGSFNSLTEAGDQMILFSGGTQGTGALTIGNWTASGAQSSNGLRLTSSGSHTLAGSLSLSGALTVSGALSGPTSITSTGTVQGNALVSTGSGGTYIVNSGQRNLWFGTTTSNPTAVIWNGTNSTLNLSANGSGSAAVSLNTAGVLTVPSYAYCTTPPTTNNDTSIATTAWVRAVTSGSSSGYQKLPSGIIYQWGSCTMNSSSGYSPAFPIAFPNACLNVVATPNLSSASAYCVGVTSFSTSGLTIWAATGGNASASGLGVYWFATGY